MAARLQKKTDNAPLYNMEAWVHSHAPILLIISIILLFMLIGALIFAIATVCASPVGTEANIYYNQLESII